MRLLGGSVNELSRARFDEAERTEKKSGIIAHPKFHALCPARPQVENVGVPRIVSNAVEDFRF